MKLALLGCGAMGSRLATRLLEAGHDLAVWSRNPSRCAPIIASGARGTASPAEATQGAEIVISMVRDDEASRAVWIEGGALAALDPDAVAVEMSTLSVAGIRGLGEAFVKASKRLVEAPVLGSLPQAEAGALVVLGGGDRGECGRIEPVFAAAASAVHYLGPWGAGAAMKLYVNAMLAIQIAALAELGPLLEKADVDAEAAKSVVDGAPVFSPAARAAVALMSAGDHSPRFPVALVEKDLGYALATAARLPLTETARAVFNTAMARGLEDENISAVIKLYLADAPLA